METPKPESDQNTPKKRTRKTYPVPEWMDRDIVEKAQHTPPWKRVELAEQLEAKAAQLREFAPPEEKYTGATVVAFTEAIKEALLFFHDEHCGKDYLARPQADKVSIAARWVISVALENIPRLARETRAFSRYRDDEGIPDSTLSSARIRASLAKARGDTKTCE